MTDKQKKALEILNELWYVSRNDGLAKLSDENYYLLLECILDNKESIVNIPFFRKEPWVPCYAPDGVCANPFHDCINCPRQFGDWSFTTPTDLKEEQQ